MNPAVRQGGIVFEGILYKIGGIYSFSQLPSVTRRDILKQDEEIELRFGHGPEDLSYKFILVPHADLLRRLHEIYGQGIFEAMRSPEVAMMAESIERYGLRYPPAGEEGRKRALALAFLGLDMPYFEIVEPLEAFPPYIPTLDGPRLGDSSMMGQDQARMMREGFWRMIQRINRGIPGFVDSGRIGYEDSQFTGGLAGLNTAWPVHPYGTLSMLDALPIAGFYLFGAFWPQFYGMMELPDDHAKAIEKLQNEFGLAYFWDLAKGTIPLPIEKSFPPPFEMEGNDLGAKRQSVRWKIGPGMDEAFAKGMREGVYRMFLRVMRGIPGLVGSGEVVDGQFNGGLAGMRTGWPVGKVVGQRRGVPIYATKGVFDTPQDAQPIVGFYWVGVHWPRVFIEIGLRGNPNEYFEKLKREFGRISDTELRRGTVPVQQDRTASEVLKGAALGAIEEAPVRFRVWSRCGNTFFWGRREEDVQLEIFINPVDLVFVGIWFQPWDLDAALVSRRAFHEGIPWLLLESIPPPLNEVVGGWFTKMETSRAELVLRSDLLKSFSRLNDMQRNAILSGLETMFFSAAGATGDRRRLVVVSGTQAHEGLAQLEENSDPTEPSLIVQNLEAGAEEAISDFGVLEC